MSKMNNRSGSEGRGRATGRGGRKSESSPSVDGDKAKKYKSKRSFSKNKSFRETKDKDFGDKPKRAYKSFDDKKTFKKDFSDKPKRSYNDSEEKRPFKKDFSNKSKRSFNDSDEKRPFKKDLGKDKYSEKPRREFKDSEERRSFNKGRDEGYAKPERSYDEPEKRRSSRSSEEAGEKKSFKKVIKSKDDKFSGFKRATSAIKHGASKSDSREKAGKRRLTKPRRTEEGDFTKRVKHDEFEEGKAFAPQTSRETYGKKSFSKKGSAPKPPVNSDGLIRLNKYLSNAGIASRRDADNLILSGTVKVNGVVADKLGTKISSTDKVTYGDSAVKTERKVYLLLNKPKDYITTVDDPKERKTVMELISGVCRERIYPVGRLDRNTTGLLLFTNDGEMTTKLTHPKFGIKKVYHVSLNKGLKPEDFQQIVEGLELEDGIVKADDLAFVGEGKKEVGIEIHSGRNRIVRRIFEHLGYDVLKLDRVVFAGLTKKDLPRGKHRFLTAKEISFLQMIG